MFRLCENIRIRHCDELSFFINIHNNTLFSIKRPTMDFLLKRIEQGISEEDLMVDDPEFLNFVNSLVEKNILRDVHDGI